MPHFLVLSPLVRLLIVTGVVAKVASVAAAWVTSPTNNAMRDSFLKHIDHVLEGLDKAGIGMGQEDRASLSEDLAVLRHFGMEGWTEPYETAALGRTLMFLSWAHAKGIGHGFENAASSHWKAAGDWVWKKGSEALDAILPPLK
jgi:hypothetical protein